MENLILKFCGIARDPKQAKEEKTEVRELTFPDLTTKLVIKTCCWDKDIPLDSWDIIKIPYISGQLTF